MALPHPNTILICLNLIPIGTYFFVLGLLHGSGRPMITTGIRDFLALAFALSGLVVNGPLNALLHSRLFPGFLVHSHLLPISIYLVLIGALAPRSQESLVLYNCTEASLAAAVRATLDRIGVRYQEMPGAWVLSDRGTVIELESFPALSNASLCFRGVRDAQVFWTLYRELPVALAGTRTQWSLVGCIMAAAGALLLALPIWSLVNDSSGLANLFRQVMDVR